MPSATRCSTRAARPRRRPRGAARGAADRVAVPARREPTTEQGLKGEYFAAASSQGEPVVTRIDRAASRSAGIANPTTELVARGELTERAGAAQRRVLRALDRPARAAGVGPLRARR